MARLSVFNFITLNGYYAGPSGDISWHRHGSEESKYAEEGAKSESILLFGRVTYQMMASYWPTPMAAKDNPGVAEGMNRSDKIVFSRTLKKVEWENTRLIKNDLVEEVKKLKKGKKDITILGSGSIVTQLAEAGLIDEYQIMVDPVALGEGTLLFKGMKRKLDLKLTSTRAFKSGVVLLNYAPEGKTDQIVS
jgi:dihydrofolate reductase